MSEENKIRENMQVALDKLGDLATMQERVGVQAMDGQIVDVGRVNGLIDRLDGLEGKCDWLYREANVVFQNLKSFLEVIEGIEDYDRSVDPLEQRDVARRILSLASGSSSTFCKITKELFAAANELLDNELVDVVSSDSSNCLTHVVSMVSSISSRVR